MVRCLWIILAALVLSGCKSYPEKMAVLKNEIAIDSAVSEYRAYDIDGGNRLLALEERGRLCQLKGDWRGSAREYKAAMDHFLAICETKPEVSVGDALNDAIASTYGNDHTRDYSPCAFEQMMLHTLDAFNRLALGEWDDFGVDVRNLEIWRNEATALIETDTEVLRTNGVMSSSSAASDLFRVNAVKRSTDNIYALYLIGLYHEIIGDMSNARIAYRDIERIKRGTATVKESLKNLDVSMKAEEGEVIVFFEEGFIPPRREHKIYASGLVTSISAATPTYTAFDCMPYEGGGALLIRGGGVVAKTRLLCDLAPLVAKSLDESMSGIITRQIARTSIKAATQGTLSAVAIGAGLVTASGKDSMSIAIAGVATFGSIAMGIYSEASERADLRSWLLLPRQVQIARFPMKAGKHKLSLASAGMKEDVVAEVKPGQKTIVHCTAVPNVMKAFAVCTDKIK